MPRAIDEITTTPTDRTARYIKAARPVPTTITRPGKTARSPNIVIQGQILGRMMLGTTVHHYRVAGADGVLYLCPPHWLPADPFPSLADRARAFREQVCALAEAWEAMQPSPEGVA